MKDLYNATYAKINNAINHTCTGLIKFQITNQQCKIDQKHHVLVIYLHGPNKDVSIIGYNIIIANHNQ
jgi:hypothetical protein